MKKGKEPHPDPDADIPREEVMAAVSAAFLQVYALQSGQGPKDLKRGDDVFYQSPDGQVHPGPLSVIGTDEAKTALIAGSLNSNPNGVQLRVLRTELVRCSDAVGIVNRILAAAHPCWNCAVTDDAAALPRVSPDPKNLMN